MPKAGQLNVVRSFCHGYACCCECPQCSARSEGIRAGVLFYDAQGALRMKDRPQLRNGQAVSAYMRERDRVKPALRAA